jgi:RNA recognition motif-containing protein
MDKYDLSSDGFQAEGILEVLEYQGKKSSLSAKAFNNVYVKNIPLALDEEDLHALFEEFGPLQSCCIMRDAQGQSKQFGFVCFTDGGSAEKAIQTVLRHEPIGEDAEVGAKTVKGCKVADLYVREAKKKTQRKHELTMTNFKYKKSIMFFSLFVKNFPIGTTEEELKIYFSSAC